MSAPKVTMANDLYEITLIRDGKKVIYFFIQGDFLLMRSDDVDADDFIDDEGYAYYIFAREAFQSQHISVFIDPTEAESILQQIYDLTGSYVCDY